MKRIKRFLLCLVCWWPVASYLAFACGAQEIEPKLDEISLLIGNQSQQPVRTTPSWNLEHVAGEFRVVVNQETVSARKPPSREPLWSAKSVDGRHLAWMGSNDSLAFLVGYDVDDAGRFSGYGESFSILRLHLSTGRWLPEIPLPHKLELQDLKRVTRQSDVTDAEALESGPDQQEVTRDIVQVFADNQFVVVLTALVDRDSADDRHAPVTGYVLRCYRENQAEPAWSVSYPASGTRQYSGALVWGIRGPQYAESAIQHLSRFGDRLLICAEAQQPILCLNIETGTELWRCERIWEYQRGFIGPSVYSHYIDRFGIEKDYGLKDGRQQKLDAAEKTFNEQFDCSVTGGPISLPIDIKRDNDTHSIFVAVSRSPARGFSGYLSDCVIYELNNDGDPISMVNVPQNVFGGQFQKVKDGLIWKCHNNGLLRLQVSKHSAQIGMGPGGPDSLTRIAWFRQTNDVSPSGWLVADRSGDLSAFGEQFAVRIPSGGFIEKQDESIYQFPVSIVPLDSGIERTMMLRVPFDGKMPLPTMNFGTTTCGGEKVYRKHGPWLLAITNLSIVGTRLEITLGMTDWTASVEFDLNLDEILLKGAVSRIEDHNDPQFDVSKINARGERDNTPLMDHAKDNDTSQLKALLSAGVDVNARSDQGWSALMSAAFYGTLETVELLVQAGAHVNIADKNCGGQTILMWAARSGRESKQKVKVLLDAGADPKQTSEVGWNALMSAASNGNLETVEFLLGQGFDATTRSSDETTVLMAAVRSADPNLMKVLLKQGADINAHDDKGMTALMRAARGYDQGEIVQLLLEAGADPNLKDNDGKTALDLTRNLNHAGAESRARILQAAMKRGTKK